MNRGRVFLIDFFSIVYDSPFTGTVTVEGLGCTLAADGLLTIGDYGTGFLHLTNGAKATAMAVYIGNRVNFTGTE